jgi:hypothetical protein
MNGLNTETTHEGMSYHVQTQDKGLNVHYIESLIYKSGKLLSSRRTYYTAFLNKTDLKEKIASLIKNNTTPFLRKYLKGSLCTSDSSTEMPIRACSRRHFSFESS